MLDKFLVFSLSIEDQDFINRYSSPNNETSILKKVPVDQQKRAQDILGKLGIRTRARFRGKRSGAMRDYTLKRDAHSVAIYVRRSYDH